MIKTGFMSSPGAGVASHGEGRAWACGFLARYGVAAAAVTVAFSVRYALYGDLDNRLPFIFFVPAAIVAAWYGGLGPGLFAAAAGLLLGDYFFLPPHHALGPVGDAGRVAVGLYTVTTVLGVVLIEHLHARIRRLECTLHKEREAQAAQRTAAGGSLTPGDGTA